MISSGFQWDEAELDADCPLNSALLSLVAITPDLRLELIGTAFVVAAHGSWASAISAAHCLSHASKIVSPDNRHHYTALSEFLPPPEVVELDSVKALYCYSGKVYCCSVGAAFWDQETDFAIITILAPDGEQSLFVNGFTISDVLPEVGDEVVMIGYGEMSAKEHPDETRKGTLQRRLVLRIGRVEGVYPDGYFLLKGGCVETSIAVFSGMSGGLVARWINDGELIEPFGLISHAPEPQPSFNRAESGHSIASVMPLLSRKKLPDGRIEASFGVTLSRIGKNSEEA